MAFWVTLAVLLIASASGAIYFSASRRAAKADQYRLFIYGCVLLFAALPIATGDWQWSLVFLPVGLVVGRTIIARKLQ